MERDGTYVDNTDLKSSVNSKLEQLVTEEKCEINEVDNAPNHIAPQRPGSSTLTSNCVNSISEQLQVKFLNESKTKRKREEEKVCVAIEEQLIERTQSIKSITNENLSPKENQKSVKEKNFVCPHPGCNKRFAFASYLKQHEICHSDKRPFLCILCGIGFARKYQLKVHFRGRHTTERPYKCPEPGCDKTFITASAALDHKRRAHKLDRNPKDNITTETTTVASKNHQESYIPPDKGSAADTATEVIKKPIVAAIGSTDKETIKIPRKKVEMTSQIDSTFNSGMRSKVSKFVTEGPSTVKANSMKENINPKRTESKVSKISIEGITRVPPFKKRFGAFKNNFLENNDQMQVSSNGSRAKENVGICRVPSVNDNDIRKSYLMPSHSSLLHKTDDIRKNESSSVPIETTMVIPSFNAVPSFPFPFQPYPAVPFQQQLHNMRMLSDARYSASIRHFQQLPRMIMPSQLPAATIPIIPNRIPMANITDKIPSPNIGFQYVKQQVMSQGCTNGNRYIYKPTPTSAVDEESSLSKSTNLGEDENEKLNGKGKEKRFIREDGKEDKHEPISNIFRKNRNAQNSEEEDNVRISLEYVRDLELQVQDLKRSIDKKAPLSAIDTNSSDRIRGPTSFLKFQDGNPIIESSKRNSK